MISNELKNELINVAEKVASELDLELVELKFNKEKGSYYLRVFYYKEGGISLDDCQSASQLLSDRLDELDIIKPSYYLEVSSPGLDRPIKTDDDLRRNLGKDVEVSLYENLRGSKKHIGTLENYNQDSVCLELEDEPIDIPRKLIALMRIHIKF